jgi:hypothetical protein
MKKIGFLIFILIFLAVHQGNTDTIRFKSGNIIEGTITTQTDEYIILYTDVGVEVTYYLDEIEEIITEGEPTYQIEENSTEYQLDNTNTDESNEFGEIQISEDGLLIVEQDKKESGTKKNITRTNPFPKREVNKKKIGDTHEFKLLRKNAEKTKVKTQVKEIEDKVALMSDDLNSGIGSFFAELHAKISMRMDNINMKLKSLKVLTKLIPEWLILLYVISWVICSFPLFIIAKKLGVAEPWKAFIPIIQFFLLLNMARKSYLLFSYFIVSLAIICTPFYFPIENSFLWFFTGILFLTASFIILPMILWMEIAQIVQKPNWNAIFMIIPIANIYFHFNYANTIVEKYHKKKKKDIQVRRF